RAAEEERRSRAEEGTSEEEYSSEEEEEEEEEEERKEKPQPQEEESQRGPAASLRSEKKRVAAADRALAAAGMRKKGGVLLLPDGVGVMSGSSKSSSECSSNRSSPDLGLAPMGRLPANGHPADGDKKKARRGSRNKGNGGGGSINNNSVGLLSSHWSSKAEDPLANPRHQGGGGGISYSSIVSAGATATAPLPAPTAGFARSSAARPGATKLVGGRVLPVGKITPEVKSTPGSVNPSPCTFGAIGQIPPRFVPKATNDDLPPAPPHSVRTYSEDVQSHGLRSMTKDFETGGNRQPGGACSPVPSWSAALMAETERQNVNEFELFKPRDSAQDDIASCLRAARLGTSPFWSNVTSSLQQPADWPPSSLPTGRSLWDPPAFPTTTTNKTSARPGSASLWDSSGWGAETSVDQVSTS
ncbi:unnamed protein product, partial [Cyprideis torosa]